LPQLAAEAVADHRRILLGREQGYLRWVGLKEVVVRYGGVALKSFGECIKLSEIKCGEVQRVGNIGAGKEVVDVGAEKQLLAAAQ
jgi:hypothetical protein